VFANLLSNASKFTPVGGTIGISATPEGDSVAVRVTDTGIGIPEELLPRVFDLFTQGDRSLDRAQGGLGIGLTLVQRLVELHGGTVTAHSEGSDRGSEFTVRLPISPADDPPSPPDAGSGEGGAARARVLVVDDNRDAADSLAELLELLGHETATAYDGPSALEQALEVTPALVLLDIGLPDMNGYEVAAALRQQPGGGELKIVAVSGYGRDSDKDLSRKAGFDDHLVKPVAMETLEKLLRTIEEPRREG
jgi:CheY-like chemotaxis protein